jgi:hypothetical protein
MRKIRVFISSVQSEFSEERQMLFDYLISDSLLGLFFEPFIFEKMPAVEHSVSKVYLGEVERCSIYIGLFGRTYGYEDAEGISPTEREFDYAGQLHKTRLIFITNHKDTERNGKEAALIRKAEGVVVRKSFTSMNDLKASVYTSLVRYLEEKEFIRTSPFDATLNKVATLDDIDSQKIRDFVALARSKRNFPLPVDAPVKTILTHLNLMQGKQLTNAAILLFGKSPQNFFLSSHVKCAHFHGTEITKPIPSYQTYKGDVFQLVNQAVDFILSKIDLEIGDRSQSTEIGTNYEIPSAAVAEAVVNAVAHRDYSSNASVQVMLFHDRLEIWNPGQLPYGLTTEKLKKPHSSIPANLLLAEPMYLSGYIERIGTGTGDIVNWCNNAGLPREPEFVQEEFFKIIIWRKYKKNTLAGQATGQATGQVTGQATDDVLLGIRKVVLVIGKSTKRDKIQDALGLKGRDNFMKNYLSPALEEAYVEMIYPDTPRHPDQAYRLTQKGIELKEALLKIEKDKNR